MEPNSQNNKRTAPEACTHERVLYGICLNCEKKICDLRLPPPTRPAGAHGKIYY